MACEEFNFSDSTVPCTAVIVGMHFSLAMSFDRDVSGSSFVMTIKRSKEEAAALELIATVDSVLSGFYGVDLVNGHQNLIISAADSIALGAGVYIYDIVETSATGLKSLNMQGTLQVKERIV